MERSVRQFRETRRDAAKINNRATLKLERAPSECRQLWECAARIFRSRREDARRRLKESESGRLSRLLIAQMTQRTHTHTHTLSDNRSRSVSCAKSAWISRRFQGNAASAARGSFQNETQLLFRTDFAIRTPRGRASGRMNS